MFQSRIPQKPYCTKVNLKKQPISDKYVPPDPMLLLRLAEARRQVVNTDQLLPFQQRGCPIQPQSAFCIIPNQLYEFDQEELHGDIIVPRNSSCIETDLTDPTAAIQALKSKRYQLISMDPPWENKSISRSKRYQTYHHTHVAKLSPLIEHCADETGCWIAVWVTNKPLYRQYILETLFPQWSCKYICTHYWLKLAQDGQPVTPLESFHRLPFEQLVVGYRGTQIPPAMTSRILLSIPSRHSWKPPIEDFFPACDSKLELFARELRPEWTSLGNEV